MDEKDTVLSDDPTVVTPEKTDIVEANESFAEELPLKDVLKQMKSKQKKKGKRSPAVGLCAFILTIIVVVFAVLLGINALQAYMNRELSGEHIQMLMIGVIASAAVAAIALIISVTALCLRSQKKGFAVTAMILAILILLSSGFAIYAYQYLFGAIKQDEEFNNLSDDKLYVVQTGDDGHINRETTAPMTTISQEEIEVMMQDQDPMLEIEWENLTDLDLPEEALEKMNGVKPEGKSYLTGDHEQISNFLLFGLDEVGSSDAVMIFSLDRVHHKLKLISIPRDSYVQVPAWGSYAKLAYPYFWGGAEWAVGTVNHNYALNITEYISVDMNQLKDIVDMIGGVVVNLDYYEVAYLSHFSGVHYGDCLLQGDAAVMYARIRESSSTDNEETRTGRQREIIMSILKSVQNMSWKEYPEFIRACLSMCTTSFETEQLLGMCTEVVQNNYTIEQDALIAHMDYWGGRIGQEQYFYVVYDLKRASDILYRLIYEDLYVSGYPDEIVPEDTAEE